MKRQHPMSARVSHARRQTHGRSIIETMIALLIGGLVLASILIVTSGISNTGRQSDSEGRMQQTAQIALQALSNEIRIAGFSTPVEYVAPGYENKYVTGAMVRACDSGFSNGVGGGAAAALEDLQCNGQGNSAQLAIRYEADQFNSNTVAGAGPGGQVPSDCRGFGLATLTPGAAGNTRPPPSMVDRAPAGQAFWMVENRYFVGLTNAGDTALQCTGNGAPPFAAPTTLLRGVERMVLLFGVAVGAVDLVAQNNNALIVNPDAVRYMTATQIDNNPDWAGESTQARWQRVISVRVCLEVQGGANSSASQPNFVNCDGAVTAINDGRQRRSSTMTINLRNRGTAINGPLGLGGL